MIYGLLQEINLREIKKDAFIVGCPGGDGIKILKTPKSITVQAMQMDSGSLCRTFIFLIS